MTQSMINSCFQGQQLDSSLVEVESLMVIELLTPASF